MMQSCIIFLHTRVHDKLRFAPIDDWKLGETQKERMFFLSFQDIKLCNYIKLPLNVMSWRW